MSPNVALNVHSFRVFFVTAQLQRKLDEYEKRKRDVELSGIAPGLAHYGSSSSHNSASDMHAGVSSVGGNASHSSGTLGGGSKPAQKMRDGLKHVRDMSSTVMSKPKEFALVLMKGHHGSAIHGRHHKFGSADNLSSLSKESDRDSEVSATNKGRSLGREGQIGAGRSDHGSGGRGSIFSSNERTSSFEERRKCLSEDGRRASGRKQSTEASESDATSDSVPQVQPTGQPTAALTTVSTLGSLP